jgi:hypothetical protein
MKKSMSALFIVAALALTSACGGGDDRPTQGEVEKAITSEKSVLGAIPDKAANCVAGVLVDSKVSDDTLNAIVENDEDYKGTDKDKDALEGLQDDLGKCATK